MLSLICAATIIINTSGDPWNEHDEKVMKRATYVCATNERYEDTPCLVKFYKKETRAYWAICGVPEK